MVDRKLAGAHYGLRDWAMQRATAVIMLIYTVAFIIFLLSLPGDYESWQAFFCTNVGEGVYPSYFCCIISACLGRYPRFVDGLHQALRPAPVFAGCHCCVAGRLFGLFG